MIKYAAIKIQILPHGPDYFCGPDYSSIMARIRSYGIPLETASLVAEGFMTDNNCFVTKREAAAIAYASNQLDSCKWSIEPEDIRQGVRGV